MTEEMRAVATLLVSEKDFAAVRRIVPPRCAALKSSFYQRQNFYWDSESSPISNSGDSMGSGQRAMRFHIHAHGMPITALSIDTILLVLTVDS